MFRPIAEDLATFASADFDAARRELLEKTKKIVGCDAVLYQRFVEVEGQPHHAQIGIVGPDSIRKMQSLDGETTDGVPPAIDPRRTLPALRNVLRSWRFHERREGTSCEIYRRYLQPAGFSDQVRMTCFENDRHVGYLTAMFLDGRGFEKARLGELRSFAGPLRSALSELYRLAVRDTEEIPAHVVLSPSGRILHLNASLHMETRGSNWARLEEWLSAVIRRADAAKAFRKTCRRDGLEARVVRLEGAGGSVYLVNLVGLTSARIGFALDRLTPRQRDVVERAARAATIDEIAEDLALSPNTVKSHLRRAYDVLGVASRTELARKIAAPGHRDCVKPLKTPRPSSRVEARVKSTA